MTRANVEGAADCSDSRVSLSPEDLHFFGSFVEGENILSDGERELTVNVSDRKRFDTGGFMTVFVGGGSFYVNRLGVISGARVVSDAFVKELAARYKKNSDVSGGIAATTERRVDEVLH